MLSVSFKKLYATRVNERVQFKEFSELPTYVGSDCVTYELLLETDNKSHSILIPFRFEEDRDIILKQDKEYFDEHIFSSHEQLNGKRMIRFGIDDNSIDMTVLTTLKEFKMGSDLTVLDRGIKFNLKCSQEIDVSFMLESEPGFSSKLIDMFVKLHEEYISFFGIY